MRSRPTCAYATKATPLACGPPRTRSRSTPPTSTSRTWSRRSKSSSEPANRLRRLAVGRVRRRLELSVDELARTLLMVVFPRERESLAVGFAALVVVLSRRPPALQAIKKAHRGMIALAHGLDQRSIARGAGAGGAADRHGCRRRLSERW